MKESEQKEIEKHMKETDAKPGTFWGDLVAELGSEAPAVVSRLFDRHYPGRPPDKRRLRIKLWKTQTAKARDRKLGISPD